MIDLSDSAIEDAVCDITRKFTGTYFIIESVPSETMWCEFGHLEEANGWDKLFFDEINRVIVQTGHIMKGGTIAVAGSGLVHIMTVTAANKLFKNMISASTTVPSVPPRVSDNASDWEHYVENRKSVVCRKFEYTFWIIKRQFVNKKTAIIMA